MIPASPFYLHFSLRTTNTVTKHGLLLPKPPHLPVTLTQATLSINLPRPRSGAYRRRKPPLHHLRLSTQQPRHPNLGSRFRPKKPDHPLLDPLDPRTRPTPHRTPRSHTTNKQHLPLQLPINRLHPSILEPARSAKRPHANPRHRPRHPQSTLRTRTHSKNLPRLLDRLDAPNALERSPTKYPPRNTTST